MTALRLVALAAALLVTTACQEQTEASTTGTTNEPTGTTRSGRGIEVPGVLGISSSEAREILEAADLPYLVAPRLSDAPLGTVLWQSPREGQRLLPGDLVYLIVADKEPRCSEYASSSTMGRQGCSRP